MGCDSAIVRWCDGDAGFNPRAVASSHRRTVASSHRAVLVLFILCLPALASAQGWIEYVSRADLYAVNFPGEPKVQDFMYLSERAGRFPALLYTAAQDPSRYSVTVVDYSDAQRIHIERANWLNDFDYPNGGIFERAQKLAQRRPGDPHPFVDPASWNLWD